MEKLYSVYVLRSLTSHKYYVGMAIDIHKRLEEHNKGKSKFTKGHRPWEIIYHEVVGITKDARKREKYFKSNAGKNYLRKINVIKD